MNKIDKFIFDYKFYIFLFLILYWSSHHQFPRNLLTLIHRKSNITHAKIFQKISLTPTNWVPHSPIKFLIQFSIMYRTLNNRAKKSLNPRSREKSFDNCKVARLICNFRFLNLILKISLNQERNNCSKEKLKDIANTPRSLLVLLSFFAHTSTHLPFEKWKRKETKNPAENFILCPFSHPKSLT